MRGQMLTTLLGLVVLAAILLFVAKAFLPDFVRLTSFEEDVRVRANLKLLSERIELLEDEEIPETALVLNPPGSYFIVSFDGQNLSYKGTGGESICAGSIEHPDACKGPCICAFEAEVGESAQGCAPMLTRRIACRDAAFPLRGNVQEFTVADRFGPSDPKVSILGEPFLIAGSHGPRFVSASEEQGRLRLSW